MDSEIKRLLKLESIKGFQLLESEKKTLAEWKKQQKRIKPVVKKVPEGFVEVERGVENKPEIVPIEETAPVNENSAIHIVKNVVKDEDKETGKIEG